VQDLGLQVINLLKEREDYMPAKKPDDEKHQRGVPMTQGQRDWWAREQKEFNQDCQDVKDAGLQVVLPEDPLGVEDDGGDEEDEPPLANSEDQQRDEKGRWTAGQHVEHLEDLLEDAIKGAIAGDLTKMDAPIKHMPYLEDLGTDDLKRVASGIGAHDNPGKLSRPKVLQTIGRKLTEARDAYNSIQV
jgi:hypothetical protein